jgi:ubiquinone/menaquinone biosynthesis C-methylase UbiE
MSNTVEDEQYYKITRENLIRDLSDPSSVKTTLDNIATLKVERVLDIGCGIGQALFPLAVSRGATGIGIDVSPMGLRMGREFYAAHLPEAKVTFIRAEAESLPFAPESFDLVNCSLALPYIDNARGIAEVSRVLRPGGVFLLKIHHARYYLRELWQGLMTRNLLSMIHGGRVLTAGTLYHLAQRQPRAKLLNESYQTKWLLRRELAKQGLFIEREQIETNPATPAFVIYKNQTMG